MPTILTQTSRNNIVSMSVFRTTPFLSHTKHSDILFHDSGPLKGQKLKIAVQYNNA